MRRILLLLAVGTLMAVLMAASAVPAFAAPTDQFNKGQLVSTFAKSIPGNPIDEFNKGQLVSTFARSIPGNPIEPPVT